ncbi:uncharacterized protein LOC132273136 [Cornus florida]|uniref:uncharacterized protein LOC132273136 n=1 Tax=Cornus florida TaxID=4283 RepID=UPI00289B015C|nr:uncharacterized protein LOC132273136 [Cornus florida]
MGLSEDGPTYAIYHEVPFVGLGVFALTGSSKLLPHEIQLQYNLLLKWSTDLDQSEQRVQMEHKEVDGDDFSDITLRLFKLSDIDDFMVWATDDEASRFCSWETFSSKESTMEYIVNVIIPHSWFRAICLNGRPIGSISVTPNESSKYMCRAEIGYVIGSKYWGKGIVTRAVKMVANTIFVEWPHLERLEALVNDDNPGSQRVLEKAGFQREGVLRRYVIMKGRTRDMVIFSLLSTDHRLD